MPTIELFSEFDIDNSDLEIASHSAGKCHQEYFSFPCLGLWSQGRLSQVAAKQWLVQTALQNFKFGMRLACEYDSK